MADKAKRKPKAKREKASVLGNLPATRPERLGRPRADAPPPTVEEPPPAPRPERAAPRRPAAGPARVEASPAGRARFTPAAKPRAAKRVAAPKPAAAKPAAAKPAAAKTAAPKPAVSRRAAAKPAATTAARGGAEAPAAPPRAPRAVRPGARALGQQRVGDPPPPARSVQPPRGTELVTTTIQAVGELAQIGLTVGGRALKRAVDRLPKP